MSSTFKPIRKLQNKLTPKALKFTHELDAARQVGKLANPDLPAIPEIPAAPTIDSAQQGRNEQDRLRRRRGTIANIYGGGGGTGSGGAGARTLGGG